MTAEQTQLAAKIRNSAWKDYLREPRWCGWKKGDPKPDGDGYAKIPMTVKDGKPDGASHAEPSDWMTFDQLCEVMLPGWGFGYQFLHGVLHPLDLDHVRNANTGLIVNEAMLLLSRLNTFSEISVSGRGIHCIFRGNVRGKQLGETCVQYWSPKSAPRFFTVTGELVGEAFSQIRDLGDDFNLVFATAAHISAKCREELQAIDPEQFAKLPAEPVRKTAEPREKAKTKTRKVVDGFDIKDFLQFYGLGIDNEADNELGHCIRLTTCPIKGAPHVGQNSTSTNFIFPTTDGGLAFHCNSTGCVEKSVHDALAALAEAQGPYPKKIYEEKSKPKRKLFSVKASEVEMEVIPWLWPGRVPLGRTFIATGEPGLGKSQWTVDFVASLTTGRDFAHGEKNPHPPMEVLMMSSEDGYKDVMVPRLIVAGADLSKIHFILKAGDGQFALDSHIEALHEWLEEHPVRLVVIDPLASYFGHKDMMHGQEVRDVLDPLNALAEEMNFTALPVAHGPKSATTAINKVAGSMQLIAAARAGFLFERDTVNKKHVLMLPIKENLATGKGLKFEIVRADHPLMPAGAEREGDWKAGIGKLVWLGETEKTANEVLEEKQSSDFGVKNKIRKWLQEMLANGPVSTAQAGEEMNTRGFSMSTVKDVCREMAVVRTGKTWSLRKEPQAVQTEFDLEKEKTI